MKTGIILFLVVLALAGLVFSAVAVVRARQQLSSFLSYLPLASQADIPSGARRWRNLSYLGDAVFVVSLVLAALAHRFL